MSTAHDRDRSAQGCILHVPREMYGRDFADEDTTPCSRRDPMLYTYGHRAAHNVVQHRQCIDSRHRISMTSDPDMGS